MKNAIKDPFFGLGLLYVIIAVIPPHPHPWVDLTIGGLGLFLSVLTYLHRNRA